MIIEIEDFRGNPECAGKLFCDDDALSWRAKGLMEYLLHIMRQGKFRVGLPELTAASRDGEKATRSAINELFGRGYITRRQERENGKFLGTRYVLSMVQGDSMKEETSSPHAVLRQT
ncbi:MAG TPA: hypothetical protein DCZ94_19060 [Lentisphaeria bacterium]|nr:MAG: hypothetical protein A2X48_08860 [Lentisphaerae bacterium GWF2_49_21]HBC89045.1 hypothetical protein [Lentisphaeria bacterium]